MNMMLVDLRLSEFHELVPPMQKEEFEDLLASVRDKGILVPLDVLDDVVLDGRSRYRAAQLAGIQSVPVRRLAPMTEVEQIQFVVTTALTRRHLTQSQKAAVIVSMQELVGKMRQDGGVLVEKLAAVADVGGRVMQDVLTLSAVAPELLERVKAGDMPAHKAVKHARRLLSNTVTQATQLDERPMDNVWCVDCEAAPVDFESVDMIFTDPPYPFEFLDCYAKLARVASRVLKPGGHLIAYASNAWLPECLQRLQREELSFHYECIELQGGARATLYDRNVFVYHKSLLWYIKKPKQRLDWTVRTVIQPPKEPGTKDAHDWAQPVETARFFIEQMTSVGQLVFDPFCGTGTTLVAAKQLGRNGCGCDLDPEQVARTKRRLSE